MQRFLIRHHILQDFWVCLLLKKQEAREADFFVLKSFESVIPDFMNAIEDNFEIAKSDETKERLLKENGFSPIVAGELDTGEFMIKTVKCSR